MLKNFAIAAIAVATIMSATPSFSQSIEIGPGGVRVNPGMEPPPPPRDMGISERQAIRIARRNGVQDVDDVARRRNVIVVRGEDRDGDDIKVVIDRYTGDVLSVD